MVKLKTTAISNVSKAVLREIRKTIPTSAYHVKDTCSSAWLGIQGGQIISLHALLFCFPWFVQFELIILERLLRLLQYKRVIWKLTGPSWLLASKGVCQRWAKVASNINAFLTALCVALVTYMLCYVCVARLQDKAMVPHILGVDSMCSYSVKPLCACTIHSVQSFRAVWKPAIVFS